MTYESEHFWVFGWIGMLPHCFDLFSFKHQIGFVWDQDTNMKYSAHLALARVKERRLSLRLFEPIFGLSFREVLLYFLIFPYDQYPRSLAQLDESSSLTG